MAHNKTLLLVEDSPADTVLTRRKLEQLFPELQIITADSVGKAYDEGKKNIFDVILLDLNLPDAYGASSVSEIKRFNKQSKIIVLTGFASDAIKAKAKEFGAADILAKDDIMNDAFGQTIEKYL